MSFSEGGMSPADLAAVTGNNNLGGDGGWWIILFLFLMAGRGFGGGVNDNYVLNSDFATIERKLDGVNNGLCDGFFNQAQSIGGVNMNMAGGFMNAELSRSNQQAAIMSQLNTMQMANQQCCCETRYNMATNTRDIIESGNANTRAILDALANQQTEALKEKIMEQNQRINDLHLAASQAAQNQYLISQLRPVTA